MLRNENNDRKTPKFPCLTVIGNRSEHVFGTNCGSSLNMRWIWLNETGKIQLMNVLTLQCLEFEISCDVDNRGIKYPVAMKQCNKTNSRQHIVYNKRSPGHIYTKICGAQNFYLQIDEDNKTVLSGKDAKLGNAWKNRNEFPSWTAIAYKGQYGMHLYTSWGKTRLRVTRIIRIRE